ncbi:MAG: FHA domain-containing protein [Planctomycetota bacterium]|jgi:pSer/pThr/pTyr-binding forkhead associated (FHA) protein
MATLKIISGKDGGTCYLLGKGTKIFGRSEVLIIQIVEECISRRHLRISFDKDSQKYYATDMKSTNGVFINNKQIEPNIETALKNGDYIMFGQTYFEFTEKDLPNAKAVATFKVVGQKHIPTINLQESKTINRDN